MQIIFFSRNKRRSSDVVLLTRAYSYNRKMIFYTIEKKNKKKRKIGKEKNSYKVELKASERVQS